MKLKHTPLFICFFLCGFAVCAYAQLPLLDNGYGQKIYQYGDSTKVETYVIDAKDKRVKDKKEYYYYKTGKINTVQGYVTGKVLNGPYLEYEKDGRLRQKGDFSYGLKDGNWISWNSTGKIIRVENYKNGKRSGPDMQYDMSGKIKSEANYVNGRKDGEEYVYDSSGKMIKNTLYMRGKVLPPGPSLKERFKWLDLKKKDSLKSAGRDTVKKKKNRKPIK